MKHYLSTIEDIVAAWYRPLPHLPEKVRRWLAANSWWIVLIGVIIQVLSILLMLFLFTAGGLLLAALFGAFLAIGIGILVGIIWFSGQILTFILSIMAVLPLRARRRQGWVFLFLILLLSALLDIVGLLVYHNIVSFIWNMLVIAASGYLLFEIRAYFGAGDTET